MPKKSKRKGVLNGEFVDLDANDIDYVLDNNESLIGPTLNLAPLQNAVSSQRLFYSSRFFSQADPLEDPDEPWVQNQASDGESFDRKMGRKAGAVDSPFEGVVEKVTDTRIKLRGADGEPVEIPLYSHFSLNRKNQFHQTPLVKPGDTVTKGQVLAKSNFTNDKGSLAIGRNARIGVVPYLGYSMDDATVISESFANRLKSNHLLDYETDNSAEDVRRDKHHYISVFPKNFTTKQLENLDDNGVVRPGAILGKNDPITLGTLPPVIREQDKQSGTFGRYLRNRRRDIAQTWKYDEPGIVRDVVERKDGSHAITIETFRPAKQSDKLVVRSGAKFTISKIIPDNEMPRTKDGEPFDMLANPLGIPSRQNPAFIMELLLGKIAAKQGKPIVAPAFNDPKERWTDKVREMLEKEQLSDVEEVWDPVAQQFLENPISTGNMHILKLIHQSEGKLSARGQGGYTQWEQPRKGGDEMGQAKRLSGLELSGLLSAGAYGYIKDGITVRGQRNDEYWRALRNGQTPPKPGQPFAWDRTQALLHGSGYMTRDMGAGTVRLGPLTDNDIERWKAEEIKNPEMIDFKTGQPVPGGLFDSARAMTNRWGKISLDYPLPNPAFEKPLLKLLGLRQSDLEAVIAGRQELGQYGTGSDAIYKALKDIDPKALKEDMINVVKSGVKTKRGRAVDVLNTLEGLERNKLAPHELMITQVPVIPSRFRPFSFQGDVFLPGDVNELYGDVFRLRDQNRELTETLGQNASQEHRMDVYDGLRALYGTKPTKNRKLSEKGVEGFLKQVLGTSPKYSVFQRNLFSKTVDSSGRGVAGLDPTLGIDEVGIPKKMAWKLYAPYVQRRLVKSGMSPADALRAVDEQTSVAENALREELRHRPGVVNRAPAWHKFNSTGAYFKLHDGPNIQVNPLITTGHNMDFDGDTLGIFVPSLPEAVEDVKNRLMPSKQIFSIRDPDKVVNAPTQDLILGLWRAANEPSKKTHVFETREDAMRAIQQGRVRLSDEIKINQEKKANVDNIIAEIEAENARIDSLPKQKAVVIKGNPKFIEGNVKADEFYSILKEFLEDLHYDVEFDEGEPYTTPPEADLWVGHSRGVDRLQFAPEGTRTIAVDDFQDWVWDGNADTTPPDEHYMMTDRLASELMGGSIVDSSLEKSAVIKKENGKYKLYTKDGKRVLGTHDTRQQAIKQEYAIQKSEEARDD